MLLGPYPIGGRHFEISTPIGPSVADAASLEAVPVANPGRESELAAPLTAENFQPSPAGTCGPAGSGHKTPPRPRCPPVPPPPPSVCSRSQGNKTMRRSFPAAAFGQTAGPGSGVPSALVALAPGHCRPVNPSHRPHTACRQCGSSLTICLRPSATSTVRVLLEGDMPATVDLIESAPYTGRYVFRISRGRRPGIAVQML